MIAAACGGSAATTTTATPAPTTTAAPAEQEMGDVLEVAAAEGDLNTFLAALEAAGIMEDFHGEGPFTLFIPTDSAFAAYLTEAGMSQAEVFAGAGMLQAILNHHIVNMMEDAQMVMGMAGQSLTTPGGQALEVTVEGETVKVGDATVERYDIHASNGIIHVIDMVLIPSEA
jgi:uncharacterized surface protein with fasciclin (FAS1) repeats